MDISDFTDQYCGLFGTMPHDVDDKYWAFVAGRIKPEWIALVFRRVRERMARFSSAKPRPHVWADVIDAVERDEGGKSVTFFSPEYLETEREMKAPLFAGDGKRLRAPFQCELPQASRIEINRIKTANAKGEINSAACESLFSTLFDVSLEDYTEAERSNIRRNRGRPRFEMPEPHKDRIEDPTRDRIAAAFGVEE